MPDRTFEPPRVWPSDKGSDWFVVEGAIEPTKQLLGGSPGYRERRGRIEIHRSQFPVVGLDADRLLTHQVRDPSRAARDRRLGVALYPHQHVGVDFCDRRRGILVADEPRTGKTLQALASHDPARGPLAIVCPLHVRSVWLGWLAKVFPGIEPSIVTGATFRAEALRRPLVVAHYDILRHHKDLGAHFGTLILDEAHALSRFRSERTRAVALWASLSDQVLALTGTPLWNEVAALWSLLSLVVPGAFGSVRDFGMRYGDPELTAWGWRFEGSSNREELKERLAEVMLYRRLADVAPTLPQITQEAILVPISPDMALEIDLAAEAMRTGVTNTIGGMARTRHAVAAVKVPAAVDLAMADLDRGEPIVIWTWHRDTAQAIAKKLGKKHPAFVVTGDDSIAKRDAALNAWRAVPGALCITITVGNSGIDLSHARLACFAEFDFTPALVGQASYRTYHASRPMHVRYLVADHPIEQRIVDVLLKKVGHSQAVGVPASEAAIDTLSKAFLGGGQDGEGDLDRLLLDILAGC